MYHFSFYTFKYEKFGWVTTDVQVVFEVIPWKEYKGVSYRYQVSS